MSDPWSATPALRDQWYVVARAADVADRPLAVEVLGERYVVWRAGELAAAPDRCPHREGPLAEGVVRDGCLSCPYHGWTFDGSGTCVRVPSARPEVPVPPAAHLAVVPVRERHGLVWLSPGHPAGEPPAIDQDGAPAFRRINVEVERWQASATRLVDNFCDVAHFPFVHAATLGPDVEEVVDPIRVEELDADFTGYRYSVEVPGAAGIRAVQQMTTGFHLPFTVRSTTRFEGGPDDGSERVLLLCATPVDDVTSLFTFVVWRNADDGTSDEGQIAFDRAIGAEDRAMLERIPGSLPLDVTATANVAADRLSVEWRRRFSALLRS